MHAAFLLTENAGWSLPKAVACVSMQPAHMSGLTDRGEIAINKRADFLRVRQSHGVPVVAAAWRNGHRIL
jgi:alpha-D-ribose 1-methylphosphonate 5-triphosphate diphosphatase